MDPHDERSAEQIALDDANPPWGDDDAVLAMWGELDEWALMDFEAMLDSAMERRPELWAERMRGR